MWNFDAHRIKVNWIFRCFFFLFFYKCSVRKKNKQEPTAKWGSDNLTDEVYFIKVFELWNQTGLGLNFCFATYYLHDDEQVTFFSLKLFPI